MRSAKRCLSVLLLVVMLPIQAMAGQVMKTTIDLRLRESPSTTSAILEVIPQSTELEILSTTGTWARTEYLDEVGYAGLRYLAPVADSIMNMVTINLNLRASPSLSGTVLTVIPRYTPIPVFERSGGWIKTVWSGYVGWVSYQYTKSVSSLPKLVTTSSLRLRSGPSTGYAIILTAPAGTIVPVLTTSGGWVKTWIFGKAGWMSQTYLKPFDPPPLRPTSPPSWILDYSNAKMEWSHTYPQDYQYGFPEMDSHYRYEDGKVHLTIDSGYEYGLTEDFLDVLKAKNVKARFYVTGPYMKANPLTIKRMISEGHQVGNHSWSHPDTVDLMADSLQLVYDDLRKWESQYQLVTGSYPSRWYYRPPSGIFSERTLGLTYWMGYTTELYQVALRDWDPADQLTPEVTLTSLMNQTKAGSIVLLHSVSSSDLAVLGTYIDRIRAKGWQFALP